jgi:uncharacterized protein with PQ loop repeat
MGIGLHHLHLRKRIHKNLEKYPHPVKWKRIFEQSLLSVAIFAPLTALPQIIKIFYYKSSLGVSSLTFFMMAVFNLLWIIYGIIHKEKAFIFTFVMWFIVNFLVIIGTIIYP